MAAKSKKGGAKKGGSKKGGGRSILNQAKEIAGDILVGAGVGALIGAVKGGVQQIDEKAEAAETELQKSEEQQGGGGGGSKKR